MDSELARGFANPGTDYRSAPFWSWNDRLTPEETARQVREMYEHGMGGFFMHSREGLETEYLGPEWWQNVRAAVEEARRCGMKAFMYDEDRWPSGFAGGLVPSRGDECRAKGLVLDVVNDNAQMGRGVLRVFRAKLEGNRLLKAKPVALPVQKLDAGEVLLAFSERVSEPSEWHNGEAYADNLNPTSVRAFIETTYEAYAREIGKDFGNLVPGIFTDEPHIDGYRGPGLRRLPWTTRLPEFFRQRRGYDLLEKLPHLFFESSQSYSVRHDYWLTVTELFAEAYSSQLGQWCTEHNIAYTGHYLCEDNFHAQIRVGGAAMPHYEYQHMPGIDILCERISEMLTVKQCSSVAHQFGRRRILSELYGCTGWNFTFEGMKWVGDWQFALGVNYRCPHLALYSLRGCRKRDYPPSFNYNTTWWRHNRVVEDYFARLSLLMSTGQPVRDVLLIHNISSAWACHDGTENSRAAVNSWQEHLEKVAHALLQMHRDFDFADEVLLERHGTVDARRPSIRVREATYSAVVLPPALTLRKSTVQLLDKYLKAGGRLVAFEPLPHLVDARPSRELKALLRRRNVTVIKDVKELDPTLENVAPRRVSIRTPSGQEAESVLYQLRRDKSQWVLFVCNTDRRRNCRVTIELHGRGRLDECDLLTGKISEVNSSRSGRWLTFETELGPAGSRMYVLDTRAKRTTTPSLPSAKGSRTVYLGPKWRFKRTEPNALPLDVCRYSLNGSPLSEPVAVWRAQKAVREILGMRQNHMNGGIQRWKWLRERKTVTPADLELRFTFTVLHRPSTPVFLVLEGSQWFSIELNGQSVDATPQGWWLDRSFHKIALPSLLAGENTLILRCSYRDEMEIEDCYLLGDFAVDSATRAIITEPNWLSAGDWRHQGYPFYPGGIVYTTELTLEAHPKEAILSVGEFAGVTVHVQVNGSDAGDIPWRAADGLDVASSLRAGANEISIEVAGSPRNLLGPLHLTDDHPVWTGCGQFRTEGTDWTDDYVTVPYGLLGQVRLTLRE